VVSLAAFSMEFKIIELQGKLLDEVKTLADKMREERIASRIAEQSLSDPNQSIPADQREL
jgi:hypothetical protein